MKSLKIAGLCLASMLVMSMALAGTASAALLWLVCLKSTGLTKYKNSKCLEASGGAASEEGWQSLGVPSGTSITVKLLAITLTLRDTGVGIGVICFSKGSEGEGVIKSGGEGEIRVARIAKPEENCRSLAGCEAGTITKVEGVNLPWKQELIETESKSVGVIRAGSGGKPPGYAVRCSVAKLAATDTCEEESGHPESVELVNAVTTNPIGVEELLVKSRFETRGHAKCTLGGANASEITGLAAILLPGGAVSINR